jgi:hypothetical protein
MSLWTDARGRARNLEIADDSAWDVGLGGSREKPVDRIEGAWEEERDGEGKVRIEPTQKAVGETGDWRESVRHCFMNDRWVGSRTRKGEEEERRARSRGTGRVSLQEDCEKGARRER